MVSRRTGRKDIDMTLVQGVNYVAAAFALCAAILWFVSASVRTPEAFANSVDLSNATWSSLRGHGDSSDLMDLGAALKRQSRWSAHAAICAGVAAILGAMPLICWKRLKLGHYPLGCWWSTIPKKKVRILLDVLGQRLAVPHDGIGQEHLGCRHHLRLYKCHLSLHPV